MSDDLTMHPLYKENTKMKKSRMKKLDPLIPYDLLHLTQRQFRKSMQTIKEIQTLINDIFKEEATVEEIYSTRKQLDFKIDQLETLLREAKFHYNENLKMFLGL